MCYLKLGGSGGEEMTDEEDIVTSQAIYRTNTLERRIENMLRWFARKAKNRRKKSLDN